MNIKKYYKFQVLSNFLFLIQVKTSNKMSNSSASSCLSENYCGQNSFCNVNVPRCECFANFAISTDGFSCGKIELAKSKTRFLIF
jgi:hypothetical protein